MTKLLIVDDDVSFCESLAEFFSQQPIKVEYALDGSEGLARAATFQPDYVLLDWLLPDICGRDLIKSLKSGRHLEVIMISGMPELRNAVQALQWGAVDYLPKPVDLEALLAKLGPKPANGDSGLKQYLGNGIIQLPSKAMAEVYQRAAKAGRCDGMSVLVEGETGTGKEHVAKLIHAMGKDPKAPLIEVNCGAITEALFESELFGYEVGAFTDARQRKIGLIETAQGGTLFLDEIGELPLSLQSKLLRVIETKRLRRLGSNQDISLDVRFVAATNRSLTAEVDRGLFRSDLFFRISSYCIQVPPLKERKDDILALGAYYIAKVRSELGKEAPHQGDTAFLENLSRRPWKGNVRELRNYVYSSVIDDVYEAPFQDDRTTNLQTISEGFGQAAMTQWEAKLQQILAAVAAHNGNKTRAAQELGITRQTLSKWIRASGNI